MSQWAVIEIAGRKIGPSCPPYFVADIGANHDGQLARALHLVELAAQAGADAVKPQFFHASTIVSQRGFAEVGQVGHQAAWKKDVFSTYIDAETPLDWVPAISARCHDLGMAFLATSYDCQIADLLDGFVDAHKIGSGDLTWDELIKHVASKGKPVLLGTGASTADEVDDAIGWYLDGTERGEYGQNLIVMQCNSNYTGDPDNMRYVNLRVLDSWRKDYFTPGLSDHTSGWTAVCAAVAKGACVIEKHFTDDWSRSGPDHAFAMTPFEWRYMVDYARATWTTLGDGVKKVEANEAAARIVQRRALRWTRDLPEGAAVIETDVVPTRPCPEDALEPNRLGEIVGHRLTRDVVADTQVQLEDVEPVRRGRPTYEPKRVSEEEHRAGIRRAIREAPHDPADRALRPAE